MIAYENDVLVGTVNFVFPGNPGGIERHGSVVIVDDAGRGKVVLQFPRPRRGGRASG